MFIDDEELRSLYETASAEHLASIEEGLLQLERQPQNLSPLKALLRDAHSLKGDSRMLGVADAETVVHQMEEVLISIEKGAIAVTPTICDSLYQGLDAVKKIAHEAVTGEPANLKLFQVVATMVQAGSVPGTAQLQSQQFDDSNIDRSTIAVAALEFSDVSAFDEDSLSGLPGFDEQTWSGMEWEEQAATAEAVALAFANGDELPDLQEMLANFADQATSKDTLIAKPIASIAPKAIEPVTPAQNTDIPEVTAADPHDAKEVFEINTIRVESSKLERLMIQADELAVAKLRILQRHEELMNLTRLWEDWVRLQGSNFSAADSQLQQLGQILNHMQSASAEDTTRLASVATDLEGGIRQIRMLPLQSVFGVFPRLVRDLGRQQDKNIEFVIEGGDVLADKQIIEALKDPLTHLLRNAIDHGIEPSRQRGDKPAISKLLLRGVQKGNQIEIIISDDGRGLDVAAIRQTAIRRGLYNEAELDRMTPEQVQSLIFAAGFSTRTTITEISGRGVGLDVVRTNIEKIKGAIKIESIPGQGCTFRILLNNSLATVDALILQVQNLPYAMPLDAIESMQFIDRQEIFTLDGKLTVHWQDRGVSVAWLADLLELTMASPVSTAALHQVQQKIPCIFMKIDGEYLGILVDELLEQQQIVVKALNKLLKSVPNISGASILGSGEICLVLNPLDLFLAAGGKIVSAERKLSLTAEYQPPSILLVEDSIPIRTQVQRILADAGYVVTAAVDGLDGFNKLQSGTFDAIVSDVEMPNMTGLEMTERIREIAAHQDLPIVLVTTLAKEEHRQRGLQAGASAYLTKGDFDQSLLLNTLRTLITRN
jgi:two-component system, chemotaxis family, sensor kinase CheA